MKTITSIVFCIFLVNFAIGQNDCRSIEKIVDDIKEINYFKNTKMLTGLGINLPAVDSQFINYEELKYCASETQLFDLLANEANNVVTAYAWKAYLLLKPSQAFEFLKDNKLHLCGRSMKNYLNSCQGMVDIYLLDYMISEFYDRLLDSDIKLSAEEIIEFLNFMENRQISRYSTIPCKDF